jgi:hypothetical protein
MCAVARRNKSMYGYNHRDHVVVRTGRTKPTATRKPSTMTIRTTFEYACSCGHVGWSHHRDMMRYPDRDGVRLTIGERAALEYR